VLVVAKQRASTNLHFGLSVLGHSMAASSALSIRGR
jgi:hypothetical protein